MSDGYEELVARGRQIREGPRLSGHTEPVLWVSFSPDGRLLASAGSDKTSRLWSLAAEGPPRVLKRHIGPVNCVSWSPDGRWLATASADGTIWLWEVASDEPIRRLEGHTDWVTCVAWSPDSRWLASGSVDETIRLWDVSSGETIRQFEGHTDRVICLAWSPDNHFLVSAALELDIRLWRVDDGQPGRQLEGHTSWTNNVAWSPDGRFLASGSNDRTVRLWRVSHGEAMWTLMGHQKAVNGVAWSPDSRMLVSRGTSDPDWGDMDEAIILWHAASGQEVARLPQEMSQADSYWTTRALAISPDGRWLASYPPDSLNDIQLWDISALDVGPKPEPADRRRLPSHSLPDQMAQQAQRHTWPWRHVAVAESQLSPGRVTTWLLAAGATGQPLPVALAHDLGRLLSQPTGRTAIRPPAYLPPDIDTTAYQTTLARIAAHPLVQSIGRWQPGDAVIGVLLARLTAGITWPDRYRLPAGPEGVAFSRRLGELLATTDSAALWQATPAHRRPDWSALLPPADLARLESNLGRLNRDEVQFLIQYGAPLAGAPDPRDLLDLLALTGLPAAVQKALSQTLRLLPRLSRVEQRGGLQTYPEGGYEGLARTGSADSLLPGELAYDEEMFLHRFLNNEALYYGRERPQERRRELAYLVLQSGFGLGGDGAVVSKAIALGLAQILSRRGYEVLLSLAGADLSPPRPLSKPAAVLRLLYHREAARCRSDIALRGVLAHLRGWRETYRARQVFWIVGDQFDVDNHHDHAPLYAALRAEAGQQVWYTRVGRQPTQSNGHRRRPATAAAFGRWQLVNSDLLWQDEPRPYQIQLPDPPRPDWWAQRAVIERYPFRDGGRDALHFSHEQQWAAWFELAEIEDAPDVDDYLRSLAPPEMVYIPPGAFLMGSADDDPEARDNEKPQHEVWLRGYYMDQYPVTNAQYRQFMEAGGYENRNYWTEAGWVRKERENWQQPRFWDDERRNSPRQPVVGVSWYEAVAYSRWAGKALPAEAQWEKAAGWDPETKSKRRYPWGDEWDERMADIYKPDSWPEVGQICDGTLNLSITHISSVEKE